MTSLPGVSRYWDDAADAFDDEADHGLTDPAVRAAWAACLARWLPDHPSAVLDAGCGTGSLARLVADAGHRVLGVDLSARMIERARAKCGGTCSFVVGDAGDPPAARDAFDVVLARHLLWTLPDPVATLRRWTSLLRPGGRLVLVEGRWAGAEDSRPYADTERGLPWLGGVGAEALRAAIGPMVDAVSVEPLTDPQLWGRPVTDERYALIATR